MRFRNRIDAGQRLADALTKYAGRSDVIVLGLPRGGIPVAHEVAMRLGAPLDVFLVRKLGVPGHPELAMGAIAAGGIAVVNRNLILDLRVPQALVDQVAARERLELDRRDTAYRGNRRPPDVRDRIVILVDDGLATGSTMQAAVMAVRQQRPARIVVAVPVGAKDTCEQLRRIADEVVCVSTPQDFRAVGSCYDDFLQTSDDEVKRLLAASPSNEPGKSSQEPGTLDRVAELAADWFNRYLRSEAHKLSEP
jgi:putative phosphoribosyl transferase